MKRCAALLIFLLASRGALGAEPVPGLTLEGKVYTLFEATDQEAEPANSFAISKARLSAGWTDGKMLSAELQTEFAGIADGKEEIPLRDAWVRIQPVPWLGLTMGQFKKPFSRNELRGFGKLEFVKRGQGNEYLVEEMLYGGRDLGAMISGTVLPSLGLAYYLGAFNGDGLNLEESHQSGAKDLVGRLEFEPLADLAFGVNASSKSFPGDDDKRDPSLLWGGDFKIKVPFLRVQGEALYGDNHLLAGQPKALAGLLALNTSLKLGKVKGTTLKLEPAFRAEFLRPDMDLEDADVWTWTPALNLHLGKTARIMADLELNRSGARVIDAKYADYNRFLLQLAFDLR